jgi:hypothetical protein
VGATPDKEFRADMAEAAFASGVRAPKKASNQSLVKPSYKRSVKEN